MKFAEHFGMTRRDPQERRPRGAMRSDGMGLMEMGVEGIAVEVCGNRGSVPDLNAAGVT